MLQRIHTVTYCVPEPERSTVAMAAFLGYREVAAGHISEALASSWNTPAVAGRRYCLLQPASGHPTYVRFVAAPPVAAYAPLRTFGWNAAELHVQDVASLAERLRDSPYEILGGPRDLMDNGAAIALQVRGPGDEVFYLTEINGKAMQASYGTAQVAVDRVFIAVLGAEDFDATVDFYRQLCRGVNKPRRFSIRVLSAAHKLDPESARYRITGAVLGERYRIEIDDYPESAIRRTRHSGDLPPGLALLTVTVADLGALPLARPITNRPATAEHDACRMSLLRGPSGEWLEILETGSGRSHADGIPVDGPA